MIVSLQVSSKESQKFAIPECLTIDRCWDNSRPGCSRTDKPDPMPEYGEDALLETYDGVKYDMAS